MSTKRVPMKLPPLKSIRVQNASKKEINPCAHAMLSMLSCWASAGLDSSHCAAVEAALKRCVDDPRKGEGARSDINYHLMRFTKNIQGPRKRK